MSYETLDNALIVRSTNSHTSNDDSMFFSLFVRQRHNWMEFVKAFVRSQVVVAISLISYFIDRYSKQQLIHYLTGVCLC